MYAPILSKIRTTQEAEKLTEEIDILLNSFFENQGRGFDLALRDKVRAWVSQALRDELSAHKVDGKNYLEGLKGELGKYKKLKLGLAIEPSQTTIESIHSFAQKNIGDKVLLEISYMPALLGGVVIVFEGKYRNFSLKKVFEDEFSQKGEEIMKLLNSKE
ncbi:MAG: hypothetical protein ACXADB_00960 [Candidatus Hermodarchaeia archaeon]|jgi:hypothetical protein